MTSIHTLALVYFLGLTSNNEVLPRAKRTIVNKKKKGKLFRFEDGFECHALNQKNADRKHRNYLNNSN